MPRSIRANSFSAQALTVARRIPYGCVAMYGEVAARAGRPRAARAVGTIMRTCSRPDVPCHRVMAAGGRRGGYGGGERLKRALLLSEGIFVHGNRVKTAGHADQGRGRSRRRHVDTQRRGSPGGS